MSRKQTLGEEIANATSHGAGALLGIAALPVLVVSSVAGGSPPLEIFAVTVFAVTIVLTYLASTIYHALPHGIAVESGNSPSLPGQRRAGAAKRVFHLLDHSSIYLLIAGSYTPFALGVFREQWGWPVFTLVWGLAITGVLLKCLPGPRRPALSTGLYLAMGWLALAVAEPMLALPGAGFAWLLAGGLSYTAHVVFFVLDERVRYAHFAWHLFVLGGTVCHFFAVLGYA